MDIMLHSWVVFNIRLMRVWFFPRVGLFCLYIWLWLPLWWSVSLFFASLVGGVAILRFLVMWLWMMLFVSFISSFGVVEIDLVSWSDMFVGCGRGVLGAILGFECFR